MLAAAAVLVYLVTLNHFVTLNSLPIVARVTGWDWAPTLEGPVLYLLTYPIRWLPAGWQPGGLNVFSAVCAALTLALLARSVALLPHDRTRDQRQRERSEHSLLSLPTAWLPPVFAVLVAGLQLTFWENATAHSGEMLNLLMFAYLVRCLLEFRIERRESWLTRLALVYGLAVTNNWAMIGFFPLFLVALVWIKGFSFFNLSFIGKMILFGLIGLLAYLVMPLVTLIAYDADAGFIDLLRRELGAQKNMVLGISKGRILLLSLTSLLPLLVMGVRWPSSFGDTSVVGSMLSTLMFHLVHGMFLAACLAVSFDPAFSPRELGYGFAHLPLYYLGALAIGYFSGYFLLVFRDSQSSKSWRKSSPAVQLLNRVVSGLVFLAFLGVPAGLIWKNLAVVRAQNGPLVKQYALHLLDCLPSTAPSVVLSDNKFELMLLNAVQAETESASRHIVLDTSAIPYHMYQRHLAAAFPDRLPYVQELIQQPEPADQLTLRQWIRQLAVSGEVYYIQPSFGYFFEAVYREPHKLLFRVREYDPEAVTPPAMTESVIEMNLAFWRELEPHLKSVSRLVEREYNDALVIGGWYSRNLNTWGAELQRAARQEEAETSFALAANLNPENVAALINLRYNERLRTGTEPSSSLDVPDSVAELINQYRTWSAMLQANGTIDEPAHLFDLGEKFAEGGNNRQAALQFLRVLELQPTNLAAQLWLANMYLLGDAPDFALEIVKSVEEQKGVRNLSMNDMVEIRRIEALARVRKGETDEAERILNTMLERFPLASSVLDSLFYVYFSSGQLTNALGTIEKQLELDPDKVSTLVNQGALYVELREYERALPPLDRALEIDSQNRNALLNRAIARMQSGQFKAALEDYETLEELVSPSYVVYYGKGEIAYKTGDTAEAIKNYARFLKLAPANAGSKLGEEIETVKARMKELEAK